MTRPYSQSGNNLYKKFKKGSQLLLRSTQKFVGISVSNENNFRVLKERTSAKKGSIQNIFSENILQNFEGISITVVLESLKESELEKTARMYPPVFINKLIKDLILKIKNEVRSVKKNINNKNSIRLNNLLEDNFMTEYLKLKRDNPKNFNSSLNLSELILQAEELLKIQKYQIDQIKSTLNNSSQRIPEGLQTNPNGKNKEGNSSSIRTTSTESLSSTSTSTN